MGRESQNSSGSALHVMCERDVGLFSLIQQVIANIPWAQQEGRIPVAFFGHRTCYWTPDGHEGRDTVWEYYFEPVVETHPAAVIPSSVRARIEEDPPDPTHVGYFADDTAFVSSHFGDHPELEGRALSIPYFRDDPDDELRTITSAIWREFIRPRPYILEQVARFAAEHLDGRPTIGVHIRGTDAVSRDEQRWHREGSFNLPGYVDELERQLRARPEATVFVASDEQASIDFVADAFGDRVISYDSLRHLSGPPAGSGPTGWIMPAYIAGDRGLAARNGEEALVECLLLAHCDCLVHNASGLARTSLLMKPELAHVNTQLPRVRRLS